MSVITCQFGQCGNQIGNAFFETLHENLSPLSHNNFEVMVASNKNELIEKWFNVNSKGLLEARNVMVDTEDKVTSSIMKCQSSNLKFNYPNVIAKPYGGSGNNWAYGYSITSKLVENEVMEAVRKEVEKCDYFNTLLSILSASGGTGSGVGTKLIQKLCEEYRNKIHTSLIILPFIKGEISTQNYNNVLTLSELYEEVDGIFLFENDYSQYICQKLFDIKDTRLKDINTLISSQFASIGGAIEELSFPEIVTNLTCHPSYKFMQIQFAPYINKAYVNYEPKSQSWDSIFQSLIRNNRYFKTQFEEGNKSKFSKNICLGNLLLTRASFSDLPPTFSDTKMFKMNQNYPIWLPKSDCLKMYHSSCKFGLNTKSASLITNCQYSVLSIDSIVDKAWNLFTSGAYLHHYEKYGVNKTEFCTKFRQMETILSDYSTL